MAHQPVTKALDANSVVLLATQAAGLVPGRTALQKVSYFVSVKQGVGIPFFSHYYGPYSAEVANALSDLLSSNFLQESIEAGSLKSPRTTAEGDIVTEWQRHNYSLTDAGKVYVSWLERALGDRAAQTERFVELVKGATSLDVNRLSKAAKVHFLVKQGFGPATDELIARAAVEGWELSEADVVEARRTIAELDV